MFSFFLIFEYYSIYFHKNIKHTPYYQITPGDMVPKALIVFPPWTIMFYSPFNLMFCKWFSVSSRVWRQALALCAASRDLCGDMASVCAVSVQRYLDTSLYRLRYGDGFYEHILRLVCAEFTDNCDLWTLSSEIVSGEREGERDTQFKEVSF